EVKAFRATLAYDAAPALALMHHARLEVRVAALAALEFRKDWRPGQAELVMQIAQRSVEPPIRAAAVLALGNLEDRLMIETLAQLLDPGTPASLRLIACETILSMEKEPLLHSAAVSGLKDLARLPNREIALGTADVVQRRLGVDLGIGLGQSLPPTNSRQAGE